MACLKQAFFVAAGALLVVAMGAAQPHYDVVISGPVAVRHTVLGPEIRKSNPAEIQKMKELARQPMHVGK